MWSGVKCSDGVVQKICWNYERPTGQVIDLAWIPPTVFIFKLLNGKATNFKTSFLPRCIRECNVYMCGLSGTFDMARLPLQLEKFLAARNPFTGSVNLVHMPSALRVIDLRWSFIDHVYFSNEAFSARFERVYLTDTAFEYLNIQCIEIEGKARDDRIRIDDVGTVLM